MTDQIPADKVRHILDEWERIKEYADWDDLDTLVKGIRALLPTPPTLADMTDEERDACQWMQADVKGVETRVVIVNPCWKDGAARVMWPHTRMGSAHWGNITPRPDLPRLEWPADKKPEDVPPVKVGDVIESADDPRVSVLPVGTVLRDLDGEEVTRIKGDWNGPGYIPVAGDRAEYGPWTVARLPKKADPDPDPAPAPALPEGWRLADHGDYGRVIVTTPTPNSNGHVYVVIPDAGNTMGYDWNFCRADRLTYIDQDADQ